MDQQAKDNRTNQMNPTHKPSGPGHDAGYKGNPEKATMDNKANQQNPEHDASKGKK